MIFRILLYIFLAYIAYRFIFGFVIPLITTTKRVRRQFREMQSKMQEHINQQQQGSTPQSPGDKKEQVGDYIDFEEIK